MYGWCVRSRKSISPIPSGRASKLESIRYVHGVTIRRIFTCIDVFSRSWRIGEGSFRSLRRDIVIRMKGLPNSKRSVHISVAVSQQHV